MKKFLKIELGSRGEVENVEVVNTTIELIEDEYDDRYSDLSVDNDNIEYLEEFSSIEIKEDIGVVMYGFSEEDTTYYIDFDKIYYSLNVNDIYEERVIITIGKAILNIASKELTN